MGLAGIGDWFSVETGVLELGVLEPGVWSVEPGVWSAGVLERRVGRLARRVVPITENGFAREELLTIRLAEVGDVAGILRVERGCEEAPQWGERVWSELITDDGPLRCVMVAEGDQGVVGFVVTGGVAGVAEIESVAVVAEARGQGIGKALCVAGMRWAEEHGASEMELEVRASNAVARRMYAGLGFVEQGIRKGYYKVPVEDAVLMATRISGVLTAR